MNKRGFTLVELLAVILVISLIATFALPQVLNQFSNNAEELSEKQREMIVEAARVYVEMNNATYSSRTNSCISLITLVNADLLNEGFVTEALGNDYNNKKKVNVNYSNNIYTITLANGKC